MGCPIRYLTICTKLVTCEGSMKGNASNVFRIWCMVKEGVVTDTDGKQWKQVRAPQRKKGISAANDQPQGPRSFHRWDRSC
jgi:hypothetical protein